MGEISSRYFVNEGNKALVVSREHGYRRSIYVRATNRSNITLTPRVGLGTVSTTVASVLTGDALVPGASCDILIEAIDDSDNKFEETYLFLYYSYDASQDASDIGEGVEFSLTQDTCSDMLFFVDEGVSV